MFCLFFRRRRLGDESPDDQVRFHHLHMFFSFLSHGRYIRRSEYSVYIHCTYMAQLPPHLLQGGSKSILGTRIQLYPFSSPSMAAR